MKVKLFNCNKLLLLIICVLVLSFITTHAFAGMQQPVIEEQIEMIFENRSSAEVTITIREGVTIDKLLSDLNLSEEDLEVLHRSVSGRGFNALITKNAFEKIKNSSNIVGIFLPIEIIVEPINPIPNKRPINDGAILHKSSYKLYGLILAIIILVAVLLCFCKKYHKLKK